MELGTQLLAVATVLGALGALVWLLRRCAPRLPSSSHSGLLELRSRLPLGPQHSLQLVRAGQRGLLLVVFPGGCTLLADHPWEWFLSNPEQALRVDSGETNRCGMERYC